MGSEKGADRSEWKGTSRSAEGIWRSRRKWKEPILTAVNQPVVVCLERLVAVSPSLEVHGRNSLRPTLTIVVKRNILERTNRRMEELLRKLSKIGSDHKDWVILTLTCASFTSVGRFETMILSAGCCWVVAGATTLAPLDAGTTRARVAGAVVVVPRTWALPEFLRGLVRRIPRGREAMIWRPLSVASSVAQNRRTTNIVKRLVHG